MENGMMLTDLEQDKIVPFKHKVHPSEQQNCLCSITSFKTHWKIKNYNSKAKCFSLPIQVYSLFMQPPSLACKPFIYIPTADRCNTFCFLQNEADSCQMNPNSAIFG